MGIDFAILAPVPAVHLESGAKVAQETGYVAFGSQKHELFEPIDVLRHNQDVPVLVYPSHEHDPAKLIFQVSWTAWYIGHVRDSVSRLEDESAGHRPPTTASLPEDNARYWWVFCRVRDLRPLPEDLCCPIKRLESYSTEFWRKNAAPRGPEVVARPPWI